MIIARGPLSYQVDVCCLQNLSPTVSLFTLSSFMGNVFHKKWYSERIQAVLKALFLCTYE